MKSTQDSPQINELIAQEKQCYEEIWNALGKYFSKSKESFVNKAKTRIISFFEPKSILLLNEQVLVNLLTTLKESSIDNQIAGFVHAYKKRKPEDAPVQIEQYVRNIHKITNNFIRHMEILFKRIEKDSVLLKQLFLNGLTEARLINIESSGSDYHKSGGQVLILTFKDSNDKEKKVVYKPSSVQADAMLIGNLQALQAIDPTYRNQKSLSTIINETVVSTDTEVNNLMPTYMIMPISDGGKNSNSDYGYIEFLTQSPSFKVDENDLNNEAQGSRNIQKKYIEFLKKANENPNCDFILRTDKDKKQFSYQCGQVAAMLCIVSGGDFHNENVIISRKKLYIIDAEGIFNPSMLPLSRDILLLDPADRGALSPVSQGTVQITNVSYPEKNLVYYIDTDQNKLCPFLVDKEIFLAGYSSVLESLKITNSPILAWFDQEKVQNIRSRFIPQSTQVFNDEKSAVCNVGYNPDEFKANCQKKYNSGYLKYNERFVNNINIYSGNDLSLDDETNADLVASGIPPIVYLTLPPMPIPAHEIYSEKYNLAMLEEYACNSVPFYYVDINSRDLMDWNGNKVELGSNSQTRKTLTMAQQYGLRVPDPSQFFIISPLEYTKERAKKMADDKVIQALKEDVTKHHTMLVEKYPLAINNNFVGSGISLAPLSQPQHTNLENQPTSSQRPF